MGVEEVKTGQELYNEHLNRLRTAVAMEKPDRTPIVFNAAAFCVRYAGGKLADLVNNYEYGQELYLKGAQAIGDIDAILGVGDYPPAMGLVALSPIKVPGRDLPDDMQWQIVEKGMMTEEDYDTIIDKGWRHFFVEYCNKYLGNALEEAQYQAEHSGNAIRRFVEAGVVILTEGAFAPAPYEMLCAARSISRFMRDLRRIPDKVLAAMEAIMEEGLKEMREQIRNIRPFAVFAGGARAAGDFISREAFERFVWPYLKKAVEVIVEEGAIAYLHLDLCWDRFLDYFRELPKGKCIFSPDSTTDIFKAKEVLQGHMCFMGDVSPTLLTLGTPDQVYEYSMRLIREFGSKGFIMAAGCCIPPNAKPENVKAMVAAALEN